MKKFFKFFILSLVYITINIFLYLLQPDQLGFLIILNITYLTLLLAIKKPKPKNPKIKNK